MTERSPQTGHAVAQRDNQATVLWNRKIGSSYFHIGLCCFKPGFQAAPGQFVMVRLEDRNWPLLSRPFSICNLIYTDGLTTGLELLCKVVGNGTAALAQVKKEAHLTILGPLGNGFDVTESYRSVCLVAGGIGVAPLVFLGLTLIAKGIAPKNVTVFMGGYSQTDLLCRDDFQRMGMQLVQTTDDGSYGAKGLVTVPLKARIQTQPPDMIYACGPGAMLKAVAEISRRCQVRCQLSVETIMACGVGACLGCAVETRLPSTKYLHTCIDGPVFDANEVRF